MNGYSRLEKVFHKIVLGSKIIQEISFNLERFLYSSGSAAFSRKPVFVMGLARSGTTTLLRLLHETNSFESITYRDVPFVLMPTIWRNLCQYFHLQMDPKERAHGDSILVDFDSPESFEDVFWRTFSDEPYIKNNAIYAYQPSLESIEKFRYYMGLVGNKLGSKKRYLSKNNNNLLRLKPLSDAFPDGKFLVMWRNPLQTASSLYKMHCRFSDAQKADPFVLDYMNLIGHYEFGLGHKSFYFKEAFQSEFKSSEPSYWLAYWIYVHSFLLNSEWDKNIYLINYEDICTHSKDRLKMLFKNLEIDLESNPFASQLKLSMTQDLPDFNKELVRLALKIEALLLEKSFTK